MKKKRSRLKALMPAVLRERALDVYFRGTSAARVTTLCSQDGPRVQVLLVDDGRAINAFAELGSIDPSRHQDLVIILEKSLSPRLRRGRIFVSRDGTVVVNDSATPRTVHDFLACLDTVVLVGGDVTRLLMDMLSSPSLRCDPDAALQHFATHIAGGRRFEGDEQDRDESDAALASVKVN